MEEKRIIPICLAGGHGQRLAPISTPDCPKSFVRLPGGHSLLQQTLARIACEEIFAPPVLIGARSQRCALFNHARLIGQTPQAILLEPKACNTALAIASTVAYLLQTNSDDTLIALLPTDHVIADRTQWIASVTQAADHARASQCLTLIGMQPEVTAHKKYCEYGYVKLAHLPAQATPATGFVQRAHGFIEKPAHADALIATGQYAIHSGQVLASLRALASAFERYAPYLWQAALDALSYGHKDQAFFLLGHAPYQRVLPLPFDRVILEKSSDLFAVICACGWQDIGDVASFCAYADAPPEWFLAQAPRIDKPWGFYDRISAAPDCQVKHLHLFAKARTSLQRHALRSEHWTIIAGTARVELDGKTYRLDAGESLVVAKNAWHRLSNDGTTMLQVMEVQTGIPDENDIERAQDDYGRA